MSKPFSAVLRRARQQRVTQAHDAWKNLCFRLLPVTGQTDNKAAPPAYNCIGREHARTNST